MVKAINMTAMPETLQAIGVMEFYSVTASVYGADAAVKAAEWICWMFAWAPVSAASPS